MNSNKFCNMANRGGKHLDKLWPINTDHIQQTLVMFKKMTTRTRTTTTTRTEQQQQQIYLGTCIHDSSTLVKVSNNLDGFIVIDLTSTRWVQQVHVTRLTIGYVATVQWYHHLRAVTSNGCSCNYEYELALEDKTIPLYF